MARFNIRRTTFEYLKETDYDNLISFIVDETETHLEFVIDTELLISDETIQQRKEYVKNGNNSSLITQLAQEILIDVKHHLSIEEIDKNQREELLFLFFYIKAGIEMNNEHIYHSNRDKINIQNLIKAKIILKEVDEIDIKITSKNLTAEFKCLQTSDNLLINVVNTITKSLPLAYYQIGKEILSESNLSKSQLENFDRKANIQLLEKRDSLILSASFKIITYLNENRIYSRQNANMGTLKQIDLITQVFDILGLTLSNSPKTDDGYIKLKTYGQRVRDYLKKRAEFGSLE